MDFVLLLSTTQKENPNHPKAIVIDGPEAIIGRHAEIKMDTQRTHEISKYHAQIKFLTATQSWIIEDLDSMNGTFLNCVKIKRRPLQKYDEIVFGGGSTFSYGDEVAHTDNADCRYIFFTPDPPLSFSFDSNKDEVLPELSECGDCSICYLPMTKRTSLPCGHVFCRKCMRGWARCCSQNEHEFICPICRHEFHGKIEAPEIIDNGGLFVHNIEPLLRKLGMRSLAELQDIAVTVPWDVERKERYWKAWEIVRKKDRKFMIFKWITNATYRRLKDESEEALRNVVCNLEGDEAVELKELREEALWLVAMRIDRVDEAQNKIRRVESVSFVT